MKRTLIAGVMGMLAILNAATAQDAEVGKAAPDFAVADTTGRTNSLAAMKGKVVVLEWTNPDCPFVKKHYDSGTMQALQQRWTGQGVVWLTVCSSAPGKQGHYAPAELEKRLKEQKAVPTAMLPDPDGKLGKLYGARTTPHLFVIDAAGLLVYAGAVDDQPSPDPGTLKTAKSHVSAALEAVLAGKPVETPSTKAYGCSVKY